MTQSVNKQTINELLSTATIQVNYDFPLPFAENNLLEEEEYIRDIFAEIQMFTNDFSKKITIANAHIQEIETPFFADYDILEMADDISGDLFHTLNSLNLYGKNFTIKNSKLHKTMIETLSCSDIFYINTVKVAPEYRGFGIGKEFVKQIPQIIESITRNDAGVLVLCASPFEIDRKDKAYKEYAQKLYKFYEDCGFTRVDDQIFVRVLGRT